MNEKLTFRSAERKDVPLILQLIKELADYEKMLHEVVADEAILETWILTNRKLKSFLRLRMEKRLDLRSFSIIFLRFSDVRAFTWRICMCGRSGVARDTAEPF